ncbi:MAG: sigma-54-dependent Fis family transcriptional regulator [Planctomycetales bacterium]|nr:sigma-54-dependent Fis family transcriptional regulator [Planctomycetales bacterium]
MNHSNILLIDDDRSVHALVRRALNDQVGVVETASTAEEGMGKLKELAPDVLLLDVMLPETTGIELVQKIRDLDAQLPIIFITALGDSDTAIEAMKLGAYDFLIKPLDVEQLRSQVERAVAMRRLMKDPVRFEVSGGDESAADDEAQEGGDLLIGRSGKMLEVYKQVGRVAAQDVTVLIRGESGTGKEVIARAIYHHSRRAQECFMAVNCAALHDTLLESELFGHEKGAFTGADRRHIGRFEQCNGGTLFLDEVGDMSSATQSKVLRLLQEQSFERVGGRETIETDVRLISATNRALEEMIDEGEFRLDLYHRLNAFEIHLPPLRERDGDLELLLQRFIAKFNRQFEKEVVGISSDALELLSNYAWPGNIRELESVVRRSMLMGSGPTIAPEHLPDEIVNKRASATGGGPAAAGDAGQRGEGADLEGFILEAIESDDDDLYERTREYMERRLLTLVLRATAGNQSQAARRLGITRGSLRNKIRDLGIQIEQVIDPGE